MVVQRLRSLYHHATPPPGGRIELRAMCASNNDAPAFVSIDDVVSIETETDDATGESLYVVTLWSIDGEPMRRLAETTHASIAAISCANWRGILGPWLASAERLARIAATKS